MGYRLLKDKAGGSFTVEAALIIPFILGVIVLFLYAAMFGYDRCVTEYVCRMGCLMEALSERDAAEIEEAVQSDLSGRLILDWDTDVTVTVDDERITVEITAVSFFDRAYTYTAFAGRHFRPKY